MNSDNLKSFKYVGKLLQNRVADGTRIIKKYNSYTSIEISKQFLEITGDGIHLMQRSIKT